MQITSNISKRRATHRLAHSAGLAIAIFASLPGAASADESGVSYWLPGRFGSLAATPQVPGWSWAEVYYHTSVGASGGVAAARQIQIGRIPANVNVSLNASLNAQADLVLLNPTYTFATPVLGGQLAIGITGLFGRASTSIDGTLTTAVGPLVTTRTGSISDSLTSVGDLYPQATLKWNAGVHNFMTYVTGDIPVGAYSPTRLANLGIGHAAIENNIDILSFPRSRYFKLVFVHSFFIIKPCILSIGLIISSIIIITKALLLPATWYFDLFPFTAISAGRTKKIPLNRMLCICTREIQYLFGLRKTSNDRQCSKTKQQQFIFHAGHFSSRTTMLFAGNATDK